MLRSMAKKDTARSLRAKPATRKLRPAKSAAGKEQGARPKRATVKKVAPKKAAPKKVAPKNAAPKRAAPKKASHGQRFADFLAVTDAKLPQAPLDPDDPRVRGIFAVALGDAVMSALLSTLVRRNTYFGLLDLETSPGVVLRGKNDEHWNKGGAVVGPRDIAIAKNGAGDLYVWNADDGSVRFLVHDEGWKVGSRHRSIDAFLEAALWRALENVQADDLEEADERVRASVRLAGQIAGSDALDDDAREKAVELGILAN